MPHLDQLDVDTRLHVRMQETPAQVLLLHVVILRIATIEGRRDEIFLYTAFFKSGNPADMSSVQKRETVEGSSQ